MRKRFYGLKRPKFRQSWNKYNLYNLSRAVEINFGRYNHYRLKWKSKSLARAYHGETVREKKWQRLFRRNSYSVVAVDPNYLARADGSSEAAGRGSGKDTKYSESDQVLKTPHMSMVFWPLERRLDTAIFRALFASSTRQARQFCVHGSVTVNGKKMIYPGYLLNPGDMFQVEPERVLYATGAPKDAVERRVTRRLRQKTSAATEDEPEENPDETPSPEGTPPASSPTPETPRKTLTKLLKQAKSLVAKPSADLTARRKHDIRAFQQTLNRTLSRTAPVTGNIEQQYLDVARNLNISLPELDLEPGAKDSPSVPFNAKKRAISDAEKALLKQAIADTRSNPVDPSKPYATPWRPRDYMSAFAFIPKYLEVHHRICSAVYLRHPVARAGGAEVPTPYSDLMSGYVHSWYLRRR